MIYIKFKEPVVENGYETPYSTAYSSNCSTSFPDYRQPFLISHFYPTVLQYPVVLLDSEYLGLAVWNPLLYHVWKLKYTSRHIYFRLQAKIVRFLIHPEFLMSERILTNCVVLPELDNMDIVAISVTITYTSWDACSYVLRAAILDFWLPVQSDSFTDSTIEKFDPKTWVFHRNLFLTGLEAIRWDEPGWG